MDVEAGSNNAGCDPNGRDAAGWAGRGDGSGTARTLAQDWITLWQSELTAMAADPELRESWQAMVALWAGAMSAAVHGLPHGHVPAAYDTPARSAGTADAPRPPPAAAAPDSRDAEIERLARHVAALERRLADIERGGDPAMHPRRRPA